VKESYLSDAIDTDRVQRALVIKLRHHGDVLLTSPVFSVLAEQIPGIKIDALVYADTAPMLEEHPSIAKVHVIDRSWKRQGLKKQWQQERRLMNALRSRHYDLIIQLTEHSRGARLARRLKPRYSVARRYRDKRGHWWRNSFTHTYSIPEKPRHTVEVHLDALRRLGIYPDVEHRRLTIVPGMAAEAKADELLDQHRLKANGFLLIHPTSRWLFKGWSRQGFADVLDALHAAGHKLILTAAPDDSEMEIASQIIASSKASIVDLSGQLNLKELAALIDRATCFIGLDSVPMHIAAATGTPCVALFGPSDEKTWGPWMVPHQVITKAYTCRPCGLDGCGNSKVSDCLMTIDPSRVISAVNELINPSPIPLP
jgi:heptosyltransferase-3